MFPKGLEELCREAKVPFPADRARLAEAMKTKGRSTTGRSIERGDFDFEYRRSELEAMVIGVLGGSSSVVYSTGCLRE